jgi:glycosyltransferase involved in cell wall biosynthesis
MMESRIREGDDDNDVIFDPADVRYVSTYDLIQSSRQSLLVMTMNEVEGMKRIMPKISSDWCDQVIIVDGGSTDGTIEWVKEQGYQVYVQKRHGFRHAYNEVLPYVMGDVIITFSPDGNSIPARIGRGGERKLQVLRWGAAYYFQFIRELWFWRPVG